MKRITLPLASLLLLAPLSAPLFAQASTASHAASANHDGDMQVDERAQHSGRHHHRHDGIERMDADHDGRVSRGEFDSARIARRSDHPENRHAPDFASIDRNHDGYVVASEVRAYRERMRPQREAQRKAWFDNRFATADLDHDGKLGRVEVSETLPKLTSHFAWLDENRDGFLSRAEVQAAHGRR